MSFSLTHTHKSYIWHPLTTHRPSCKTCTDIFARQDFSLQLANFFFLLFKWKYLLCIENKYLETVYLIHFHCQICLKLKNHCWQTTVASIIQSLCKRTVLNSIHAAVRFEWIPRGMFLRNFDEKFEKVRKYILTKQKWSKEKVHK